VGYTRIGRYLVPIVACISLWLVLVLLVACGTTTLACSSPTQTDISAGIGTNDNSEFYVPYKMDPSNSSRLVLGTVLDALEGADLHFTAGDMRPRAGLTLAPAGALYLELRR